MMKYFMGSQRVIVFLGAFLLAVSVNANPVLDNIAAGQATVQQTPDTTVIHQSSQQAILNWQSFNIGAQEATHFIQPTGGIALNRINPQQGASQIYGSLTATGQIILINPAGFYFGPSAYVNVGGLIASTANMTDQDFLNKNYQFSKVAPYSGSIINEGQIIAADHGLIALVAPTVINNGLIQANVGHVILASGDAFTMSFSGNDLINFAITEPTSSGKGVTNTANGRIVADGGKVLITAQAAQGVLDNVINMDGIVQANSVGVRNGEIILSGGSNGVVRVAGKISASGKQYQHKGGNVVITGKNILLDSSSVIDVSGDSGGGNINIGGNAHGAGPLQHANAVVMMPGVTLNADAIDTGNGGNIVLWSDNVTKAYGNISARGGAWSGDGGFIETSGHQYLDVNNITVDTSAAHGNTGMWLLDPTDLTISNAATTNVSQASDIFTADNNATISNLNVTTLINQLALTNATVQTTSGGAGAGAGNITVLNDITWSSTNTLSLVAFNNIVLNANITALNGGLELTAANNPQSIMTSSTAAVSVANFNLLQGQWFQIFSSLPTFTVSNNFQLNSGVMPSSNIQFIRATSGDGLVGTPYVLTDIYGVQGIGSNAATLDLNYQLTNNIDATGTGNWNSGAGFMPIGLGTNFSGSFNGQGNAINNLFINLPATPYFVGLFSTIGSGATVSNISLMNVNITGKGDVGALAGLNQGGTISSTMPGGITITGTVTGSTNFIGGLVGNNGGTIIATPDAPGYIMVEANVTGTSGSAFVGGVAGFNPGSISNVSYSGTVSAPTANIVGGLVGDNAGLLTNSYTTNATSVAGNSSVGGLVGENVGGTISNSYNAASVVGVTSVGGIAGKSSGSIDQVYNLGTVFNNGVTASPNSFGGIVGTLDLGGSLTNAYNNGYVNANQGGQTGSNVGGVIGSAALTGSTIGFLYNTGYVVGATTTGGLIGFASGTPTYTGTSYWNSDTSGQAVGVSNLSNANIVSANTAQMTQQSTFTGWNFTSIWNIISGFSYPYLQVFYPTTPRIISSSGAPSFAGTEAKLSVNGVVTDLTFTGANGASYFLEGPNAISGINTSIADGANLLVYLDGTSTVGNVVAVAPAGNASLSGVTSLSITANAVTADQADSSVVLNNNILKLAVGSLVDPNILYSVDGSNNLSLSSGNSFITTLPTTYILDGNLNTTSGDITFNGPVSIITSSSRLLTAGTGGNITINSAVTNNGNGGSLTLQASTGSISINNNLMFDGGTNPNGASIIINAPIINITNATLSVNGTDSADGTLTDPGGNGGIIDITASTSLGLTNAIFLANGGNSGDGATSGAGGNGGSVSLTTPTISLLLGSSLHADGGDSGNGASSGNGGAGGTISILPSGTQTITTLHSTDMLSASGGIAGMGGGSNGVTGIVQINGGSNATGSLTVNTGSNIWTLTSNQSGSVNEIVFTDMSTLNGANSDTLVGPNSANIWNITGNNSGIFNSIANFSGMNNLVGGSGNDSFIINGGSLSGSIDGDGGTNSLSGDNVDNTVMPTGPNSGTVSGIGGGYSNIQILPSAPVLPPASAETSSESAASNTFSINPVQTSNIIQGFNNGQFSVVQIANMQPIAQNIDEIMGAIADDDNITLKEVKVNMNCG